MAEILVMPKLGLTMEEGVLTGWLVKPGDSVDVGQPICEVETEKLSVDVESPHQGVILRTIEPSVTVPVGAPIGIVGDPGEEVADITLFGDAEAGQPATSEVTEPAASEADGAESRRTLRQLVSSPVARKLAAQGGVDLSGVTGSGPDGRITRKDVEHAIAQRAEHVSGAEQEALVDPSRMRKAIAASMTISATIPQFTLERDIDVAELETMLRDRGRDLDRESRPTFADAVTYAAAHSLAPRPMFLSSWTDGGLMLRSHVNVGIAVALPEGLVVPVIEDADRLALPALAVARRRLQDLAADGTLRPAANGPAVFSISNLGALGVDRFHALVNPSESGILAVGRVRSSGGRRLLTLALSCDHRVVDGADGARLLGDVADWLETDKMHQMFEGAS